MAGRSPAATVKRIHSQSQQHRLILAATARANSSNKTQDIKMATAMLPEVVTPPVEPFLHRVSSTKDRRNKPPPVPDEDGFVRMAPRQKRPQVQQTQQQQSDQQQFPSNMFVENIPAAHKRQTSDYDNVTTPQSLSNTTTTTSKSVTASSSAASSTQTRSSSLKNYPQKQQSIHPSVFAVEVSL